jgi:LCP family protein required for cell wall assembly
MSTSGTVVLRRTWPQRLTILFSLAVVGAALVAAWFIDDVFTSIIKTGRVDISGEILITDTVPGEPVNFLLIGQDSAVGLDADDPVTYGRDLDPDAKFNADSITILRVDPSTGQAWVLSLPRDLLVETPNRRQPVRINSTLVVGGPQLLVETITDNFGITVNHFVALDFLGFREVVDTLDGVPVWFDNPARDTGSGLDIPEAGCRVLDGVEALQYVRARKYQELVDGRWTTIGNSDFGRIERQQDFLVLALDRAITRGARSVTTLSGLIEAGAASIVLDSELTVAELIDLGVDFADFNPENLQRFSLEVETIWDGEVYIGELTKPDVNEAIFEVFRGGADLPAPEGVSFDLYTSDSGNGSIAEQLGKLGFVVSDTFVLDTGDTGTVIVYPTGELAAAETIARWIEPIPRLVEDPDAGTISVVLGDDLEQILFIYPHEIPKMRAGVAAQTDTGIPDLSGARRTDTTTTTTTAATPVTTAVPTTTTTTRLEQSAQPTTTTTVGIIGQAPEGQSCG